MKACSTIFKEITIEKAKYTMNILETLNCEYNMSYI